MRNKEDFVLTERGLYWLMIDIANTYGEDKLSHEDQYKWSQKLILDLFVNEHLIKDKFDKYLSEADSPFEFKLAIENYKMYLRGEPINGIMYVDCSNQALQLYAVATGDLQTAKVCNLAGEKDRADGYQMLADAMNSQFQKQFGIKDLISRKLAKKPMMTTLYGKQKAWDSMLEDLRVSMLEFNINVDSEDFQDWLDKVFIEAMEEIAPNAMSAMAKIQDLNHEMIGTYTWELPDGFKVKYDVKSETYIKAERTTKKGQRIAIEDSIEEYKPSKWNAGMAPNVIHSIDAYLCRRLLLQFPEFLTTIHDAYGCHYNFIDDLISLWKDEMIFLLESNILDEIMKQIAKDRSYRKVNKANTLSARHIINSMYALS